MTETVEISAMTEKEQSEYIRARLSDKWWRMNNLYMIENEQGKLVRFRLRPAQELLWVYCERPTSRTPAGAAPRWFLHGIYA